MDIYAVFYTTLELFDCDNVDKDELEACSFSHIELADVFAKEEDAQTFLSTAISLDEADDSSVKYRLINEKEFLDDHKDDLFWYAIPEIVKRKALCWTFVTAYGACYKSKYGDYYSCAYVVCKKNMEV